MNPVAEIFAEYVFAEREGNGDPRPFLDRVDPGQRAELEDLIDAYLAASPGRAWDPEAFTASNAAGILDPLSRALNGVSGTWPVMLPGLRERARVKRGELVDRLAERLGFPQQRETVEEYYHGMEYGTVESAGVSDRVLDALGELLGAGRDTLREAGERMGGGGAARGHTVFAREAPGPDVALTAADAPQEIEVIESDSDAARQRPNPDRDAVIRLFTGGG
jgi:hypothetical protein